MQEELDRPVTCLKLDRNPGGWNKLHKLGRSNGWLKVRFDLELVVELRRAPGSIECREEVVHDYQDRPGGRNIIEIVRLAAHGGVVQKPL